MLDDLLPYYNRELTYIRRLAADFARQNARVAGNLRLSADAVEDPHVAHLIEAFAFLTAHIRRKLDDDFPELTDALLSILYPHYLAPIPSMAIVQMVCQPDLSKGHTVPAGTVISTRPVDGESCCFRTSQPATLWPIEIEAAAFGGRPLVAPANPRAAGAVAALRLTLRCCMPDMTFSKLGPDTLRFFIRAQPQQSLPLYELILNNTVSIALTDGSGDPAPVILGAECIRPVGFECDEGVLPFPPRSFVGYRLLTEYFTFLERFLFFDVTGLSAKLLLGASRRLEIFLYLNRTSRDLERSVSAEMFALGCTPMINLFRRRTEPIMLSRTVSEYRIVPDARREAVTEIHSIDRVTASSAGGEVIEFLPFYALRHAPDAAGQRLFWHAARRPAGGGSGGTEIFLSLVDLDFTPTAPADWVLSVEATCVNRDLPAHLPYGGGHPYLELVDGAASVASIACVTPPTPTLRPPQGQRARWRLISHLALNHLSLTGGEDAAESLKEILRLYDFRDSEETRATIDSVHAISAKRATARAPWDARDALCHGIDVTIRFDDQRMAAGAVFLLATVLERFIGLYGSINAFTRLTAMVESRQGVLRKWPPRASERQIL